MVKNYAPDYVINADDVIDVAFERTGYDLEKVVAKVDGIGASLTETFERSDRERRPTSEVAGDISANDRYGGDLASALGAITARAILIPCTTDMYFPPKDNAREARHMPSAELRPYDSPWGHCVATPGRDPRFMAFLDTCARELLRP